jgi:hypothetical protein
MTLSTQQLCIGAGISGEPVMLDPEERRRHLCAGFRLDRTDVLKWDRLGHENLTATG